MQILNNKNYSSWKIRMEAVLVKEDLIDVVEKEKPAEAANAPADGDKKDRKARATIVLGIENDQLAIIKKSKTAKEAWDMLKVHHEKESLFGKVHLFKRIFSLRMSENGNMSAHLSEIDSLVDRLESAGEKIQNFIIVARWEKSTFFTQKSGTSEPFT
jgi:hypothetical protein